MTNEKGCLVCITGLRAALRIQKLISWTLILKWIAAKTLQATKAEDDTVPAIVQTQI